MSKFGWCQYISTVEGNSSSQVREAAHDGLGGKQQIERLNGGCEVTETRKWHSADL
jgi:hypothetical protein